MKNEDWQPFFEKLGSLLNEYGLMISDFKIGTPIDKRIRIASFNSDGSIVRPVYLFPKELESKEVENETNN